MSILTKQLNKIPLDNRKISIKRDNEASYHAYCISEYRSDGSVKFFEKPEKLIGTQKMQDSVKNLTTFGQS